MGQVFISYAGDYGKEFASIIKKFYDDITEDNSIAFYAEKSTQNGDDWLEKIKASLSSSNYFIGLLDDFYFSSFYSSMEYGYSQQFENLEYRFFKIDNDFEVEHCPLAPKQIAKSDNLDVRVEEITIEILKTVEGKIPKVNEKTYVDLRSAFVKKIKNTILKVEQTSAEEIKQAKVHLKRIEELAIECIKKNHIDLNDDGMKRNYTRMPLRILDYTKDNMRAMASGRIIVELPRFVQDFWSEGIMGFVGKTIWTTNLRGTHGRSVNNALIKKQKEAALDREIGITRIFLFSDDDIEDIVALQSVIYTQINEIPNIKLYLISEDAYKSFDYEISQLSYQWDFMILDDEYAYLTFPSKNKDEIKKSELIDQIDQLQTKNLQTQIINASKAIERPYTNNRLVDIFTKTDRVQKTISFFEEHNIEYLLSRNEAAGDCLDASLKRYRNNQIGIPLSNELKTIFGEYGPKNKPSLVILNFPGDCRWDQDKVRAALNNSPHIRYATSQTLEIFNIEFAQVNPFLIQEIFKSPNVKSQFEGLTTIFDQSLLNLDHTMMTNSGELTWGIEFKIDDVIGHFDNCIIDKNIIA